MLKMLQNVALHKVMERNVKLMIHFVTFCYIV